eukprot:9201942-Alexandrium_andersonii.AAC.1
MRGRLPRRPGGISVRAQATAQLPAQLGRRCPCGTRCVRGGVCPHLAPGDRPVRTLVRARATYDEPVAVLMGPEA